MRWLWLVLVVGVAGGCNNPDDAQRDAAPSVIEQLVYVRDARSGLCFAYGWRGSGYQGGPMLAQVPCEKVEQLLMRSR